MRTILFVVFLSVVLSAQDGNKNVQLSVKVTKSIVTVSVDVTPAKSQGLCISIYEMKEGRVVYNHTNAALAGLCGNADGGGHYENTWVDVPNGVYKAMAEVTRQTEDGPVILPSNPIVFETPEGAMHERGTGLKVER